MITSLMSCGSDESLDKVIESIEQLWAGASIARDIDCISAILVFEKYNKPPFSNSRFCWVLDCDVGATLLFEPTTAWPHRANAAAEHAIHLR